jgi:hypothetical protein
MMTDENTLDSKSSQPELTPEPADKKGQMLVIYLPEGSVIVDRTDMHLSSAPQAIVEHVVPISEPAPVEPIVERAVSQQPQATLQEVVQLVVQEVLQITGQSKNQDSKAAAPNDGTSTLQGNTPEAFADYPAPVSKNSTPHAAAPTASAADYKGVRRVHVRRRRRINWVHGINTFLVVYLLLIAIVPAVLSSAFGMAIYASKSSHPGALIAMGDLMVCTELPASKLKVNDVLLVRDGNSWRLDARQITSNTTSGSLSTITTASMGGVAIDKTYVLPKNSSSYVVSRVIPKLGYAGIVLSSTIAKVVGGLFILILNLTLHYRRSRKRRLETIIR